MKINLTNLMAVSLASFLLSGCVVKDKNKSPVVVEHTKVPNETITTVKTVPQNSTTTYTPNQSFAGKKERGYASWYGKELHGERVSSGETFDMYALTAAHRTIPFNTLVKVTNLKNGKSVVVRINDRGPYNQGRIIDLSYKAALELGMTSGGSAEVQLEVMGQSNQSYDRGVTTVSVSQPVTTVSRETYNPVVVEEVSEEDFAVGENNDVLDTKTINQIDEIEKSFVKPKRKAKKIYKPRTRKTVYKSKKNRGSVKIQIGSFTKLSSAKRIQKKAKRDNPKYSVIILKRVINGTIYHKVAIKGFKNRTDAKKFINSGKYNGAYILK